MNRDTVVGDLRGEIWVLKEQLKDSEFRERAFRALLDKAEAELTAMREALERFLNQEIISDQELAEARAVFLRTGKPRMPRLPDDYQPSPEEIAKYEKSLLQLKD